VSLDPCMYGFEIVDELLVVQVGKNPIPEDFTVKCSCLQCAKNVVHAAVGIYLVVVFANVAVSCWDAKTLKVE